MRWKTPKPPKNGDQRTRYAFAWKPTKVGDYMVWLERYAVEEEFFQPISGNSGWWAYKGIHTLDYYC